MRRKYASRLARVEEKRNIKKAYIYVVLSVVAVALLFFWGLPLLIKFASFFTNLGKADKPVDISDITPPAPPAFESFPEYTSQSSLKLAGTSEEGAPVTLTFNRNEKETIANSDGRFNFEVNLRDGENTFFAKAKDPSGNEGFESPLYTITFDNDKPDLTIQSPSDGDSFYGSAQRQVVIKGTTDPSAEVYVNERFTAVAEDGAFSFATTLSEGINDFEIKAKDKAGNETSVSISLNFAP